MSIIPRPRDFGAPVPARYDRLTQPERADLRARYVAHQGGKCHYCEHALTGQPSPEVRALSINWRLFPGGEEFLRYPIHLHHSHRNSMTIGAVHARCNAVLWQYHGE